MHRLEKDKRGKTDSKRGAKKAFRVERAQGGHREGRCKRDKRGQRGHKETRERQKRTKRT